MTVVQELLVIELFSAVEEEYPNQNAEYRVHQFEKALVDFSWRVLDKHMATDTEARAAAFRIAVEILKSFQGRLEGDLLCERLAARKTQE